ncbi:hypothetical protein LX36DRAFT_255953 [Colletotrichum falcatum]|nr:hypothetical protein LX36DRAFT_255953 [Colletotrichum falcatum]
MQMCLPRRKMMTKATRSISFFSRTHTVSNYDEKPGQSGICAACAHDAEPGEAARIGLRLSSTQPTQLLPRECHHLNMVSDQARPAHHPAPAHRATALVVEAIHHERVTRSVEKGLARARVRMRKRKVRKTRSRPTCLQYEPELEPEPAPTSHRTNKCLYTLLDLLSCAPPE